MQYHLEGFRPGDPHVSPAVDQPATPHDKVDVIIVGCGPAGLTLAAQLAVIGGLSVRIFDRKEGPLEVGQADGIACRSMEMFEAFGFVEKVRREAYWVNETTFWRPRPGGSGLRRADRIQDVEDDLSHQPHVILNQARIHDFFLEVMANAPARLTPDYRRDLVSLTRDDTAEYPVTATFDRLDAPGEQEVVRAKYIVGCDGARSAVRKSLGLALKGDAARQLWGVMDVLADTDFPDIRLKCAIQSAEAGSILLIPREGGYMVRLYIELDALHGDERAADRNVTAAMLEQKAQAILAPYRFEVREVAWWSAYEIGQRVCDAFDDANEARDPRIFIAGDACHTHSPKAGQGMNVSMADTFNLGWKLASVLKGQAGPSLLATYSAERQAKAQELIDFDRDMARLFSEKPRNAEEEARFQTYFQTHGRYTAGVETTYDSSPIVGPDSHQHLATGQVIGKRFHSAPVIRLADAKPLEFAQELLADGRWRIVAFAGEDDDGTEGGAVARLCDYLSDDPASPLQRYTPRGADPDAVIDLRAVFQQSHRDLDLSAMPGLLLPRKGRLDLIDYEKIFTVDTRGPVDIFKQRGIDRRAGALVVIRPDQFVAHVLPLDSHAALSDFFAGFMQPAE
ncbi:FAD-dependent monooxygenase [Gymnodinialimonas ceratoperidinii]|uniref:FAD-dependent monooxygenase n=1 Tax=Gymnodinialimonas ceratoperidinii TaxID=2856823 RepID=A0A8F6TSM9_9RHOB|nr:FAD-dependent monooxygenase [Gymnodinialimonas ceratoperidinii]QXT38231.1 FAD-dependent monooxygenase [Gymnodinialimonas ceratoperidinii]